MYFVYNVEFPVPPHLLFTRVRVLAVRGGKGNLVFFSFFRRQTFQDQKRQPHATRVYYKAHNHPVPSPNALNLRVTLFSHEISTDDPRCPIRHRVSRYRTISHAVSTVAAQKKREKEKRKKEKETGEKEHPLRP